MGTSFVGKVRDVRWIAEVQIGEGVADMVSFKAQVNGHEATAKANRIQAWQGLSDWQLADRFDKDRPVVQFSDSLVEWAVRKYRMVAKADTPSEVQAMCTVQGYQGVWQGLSQDATWSRWQVISVQRRGPNDKSKTTAAIDHHDFYQCKS